MHCRTPSGMRKSHACSKTTARTHKSGGEKPTYSLSTWYKIPSETRLMNGTSKPDAKHIGQVYRCSPEIRNVDNTGSRSTSLSPSLFGSSGNYTCFLRSRGIASFVRAISQSSLFQYLSVVPASLYLFSLSSAALFGYGNLDCSYGKCLRSGVA